MGASTHVVGFKPPDAKWMAMKVVWDSCMEAGVNVPTEVAQFFEGEAPTATGVKVELTQCLRPWRGDAQEGYEIDVSDIPKDVRIIRFYTSW